MNKASKKSIGWCDMTLNPIKGKCQGGCWYCWTNGFRQRGFLSNEIKLKTVVFNNLPKKPKKIFLCSTHDLFGSWIPKRWRDAIFLDIEECYPQHTFQILTKFPQNIDRPMPDNVWLGVTITLSVYAWRLSFLKKAEANIKFVSVEPMLGEVGYGFLWFYEVPMIEKIDWAIIGKLTQYGHKYDPRKQTIKWYVEKAKEYNIPIFLKNNLKEIWGEPLIQEFPAIG